MSWLIQSSGWLIRDDLDCWLHTVKCPVNINGDLQLVVLEFLVSWVAIMIGWLEIIVFCNEFMSGITLAHVMRVNQDPCCWCWGRILVCCCIDMWACGMASWEGWLGQVWVILGTSYVMLAIWAITGKNVVLQVFSVQQRHPQNQCEQQACHLHWWHRWLWWTSVALM